MAPAVPGSPCVRVLYSYKILGWVGMLSEAGRFRSLISFPCLFLEGFFFPLYGHQALKVCWKAADVCWNGLQPFPKSRISSGVSAITEETPRYPAGWCDFNNK